MENPIKIDDLGGKPTIFGNIHIYIYTNPMDPSWDKFNVDTSPR